jgi:DNA-binding NtrC family response regulator
MPVIAVVDDEVDLRDTVRRILEREGHAVAAGPALPVDEPDVLLTDLMMPGEDGLAVLARAQRQWPNTPVVLLTAFATVESAVAAMKGGAWDYVAKPFTPAQLRSVVDRALRQRAVLVENQRLRAQLAPHFVTASPVMEQVAALVARVAPTDLSVLITGESGTGKEVVARMLHARSRRGAGPFVPVDCAAIPPSLMESELFGHEKGAFTDASTSRRGLVEEADGGTFFLDEIGDLELGVQSRLLRLLQEREFRRVGAATMRRADLRVLAATHRDLEAAVSEGRFREDLFHRLNVVRVHLPALRERPEEVVALAEHFVARFRAEAGRGELVLSAEVVERLRAHAWPGNVRELANVARYVAGLSPGPVVGREDLPPALRSSPSSATAPVEGIRFDLPYHDAKRVWTERFDEAYVARLLEAHGGNVSAAARTAGLDRKTIQRIQKRQGD